MNELNTGFSKYSNADLLTKANLIVTELGEPPASSYYPLVDTDLAPLENAIAAFNTDVSLGNAAGAAEARADSRAVLIEALQELAVELEIQTPGDRAKLATTGYDLRKLRESDPSPTGRPQNVRATSTGNPGEVQLKCDGVDNASAYNCRASQNPEGDTWVAGPTVTAIRNLLMTDLERGKDWYFQIQAVGHNGASPWSDVALIMVV